MSLGLKLASSSWDEEEIKALQEVIKSGNFSMGKKVLEFEKEFASYVNSKYSIMVNSGSSANLLMVAALFFKKDNPLKKLLDFLKTKIGKSSLQGEEIVGVELNSKSIRLAQINADKSNQWVLEKFYTHEIDIPDESSILDNSDKIVTELTLAIQKSKTITTNVAISIPVTVQLLEL